MEILKLEVSALWGFLRVIIILTVSLGILGIVTKSKSITFDRYLSMFKVLFYLILAFLTLTLNFNVNDDNIHLFFDIPKELTVGQMLVIIISVLEVGSNLVAAFTLPRSEHHLMSRKDFGDFQREQDIELTKIRLRLAKLEKRDMKINEKVKE